MPNYELLGSAIGYSLAVAFFLYSAYWALYTRHILRVRLYRNQAFGLGLVSLAFAFVIISGILLNYVFNSQGAANILTQVDVIAFLSVFYWIDSSLLASRRSDPLLRDTLAWSKVRIALWSLNIICIGTFAWIDIFYAQSVSNFPAWFQYTIPNFAYFVAFISGVLFLSVGAIRSKDKIMRKHIKWFGIFAAVILVTLSLASFVLVDPLTQVIVSLVGLVLGGYCLYRSSRSLVAVNRLSVTKGLPA